METFKKALNLIMKKDKLLSDARLINWLNKKGITTPEEMRGFLHPTLSNLNNPFLFKNMNKVVQIIKNAIKAKKQFVIVGDYDCDGISSATLLYKYFESVGAKCDVYIPSRFEDGYGLNISLIDEIIAKSHPDILITVDLGISAVAEVDYLNNKGVLTIVTDHHEPQDKLPNCLILDPKADFSYPCSYLCGAGVVFKLVTALAGCDFANNYLDLVAIATIGDIVPLLGENRAIAKLGLEKLSKKDYCLLGLKLLLEKLEINNLESSDVYLKIVPKINSSGRMDSAKKVFDYFVSNNKSQCLNILSEILADNEIRLNEITRCYTEIEKELEKIDILNSYIICVKGDFHEGVLGILASKIALSLNKPAIVFSKTKDGTYKGSGRSVASINLHEIIMKFKDYCLHFGGHKMALGLEISADKLNEFIIKLNDFCASCPDFNDDNLLINTKADIEIDFSDISAKFLDQLNLIAPFGCENPKPTFFIKTDKPLAFSALGKNGGGHVKITNDAGASVVFFGGDKYKDILASSAPKELVLDLDYNEFKNKKYPQALVKSINIIEPVASVSKKDETIFRLYNFCHYLCQKHGAMATKIENLSDIIKNNNSSFGLAIVATTTGGQNRLLGQNLSGFIIGLEPPQNIQNTIIISPSFLFKKDAFAGYKCVVVLDNISREEMAALAPKCDVFYVQSSVFKTKIKINPNNSRTLCAKIYSNLNKNYNGQVFVCFANIIDSINKLCPELSLEEIEIGLLALEELEIIAFEPVFGGIKLSLNSGTKKDLSLSKILKYFGE